MFIISFISITLDSNTVTHTQNTIVCQIRDVIYIQLHCLFFSSRETSLFTTTANFYGLVQKGEKMLLLPFYLRLYDTRCILFCSISVGDRLKLSYCLSRTVHCAYEMKQHMISSTFILLFKRLAINYYKKLFAVVRFCSFFPHLHEHQARDRQKNAKNSIKTT